MEVPIIRTCKLVGPALLLSAAVAAPASAARRETVSSPGLTYLEARAAELKGDEGRSARLFAVLAAQSGDAGLTKKAVSSAIAAGDSALALRLARTLPAGELPIEAKLLLVADELRRGRNAAAVESAASGGSTPSAAFLSPLIRAWDAAERKDLPSAMAALDSAPDNGLLAPFRDEHRALILLRFKRAAEAAAFSSRAIGAAGGRRGRLRMVFADAFLRAGDRERAAAVIANLDDPAIVARVRAGRQIGQRIDSAASAFSELVTALALDLSRGDKDMPIALLNVARHADPANSGAALLQGLLLDAEDRPDAALAVLRSVRPKDALSSQARNYEVRLLASHDRFAEALAIAQPLANRRDASMADVQRLGDVYRSMDRHAEAAEAYRRAIALGSAQGLSAQLWPLYYQRAVVLEDAGRWTEAQADLRSALALAPEEPAILNFLGYGQLERGESLDDAEAMIRKASSLAPEEAAITDSLGWALYKRGRLPEAIATLQKAAAKDAAESEIHEHLGDALYAAGRRYEARFAWSAALITAEDDIAKRVKIKLQSGLTPATAAP